MILVAGDCGSNDRPELTLTMRNPADGTHHAPEIAGKKKPAAPDRSGKELGSLPEKSSPAKSAQWKMDGDGKY